MNRTSAFNYEWLRLNLLFWCLNNKVLDRIYNCFQTLNNRSIRSYFWDGIWFLLHFLSGFLFGDTFRAVGQDEKYESLRNPNSLEIRRWSSSEERLCLKKICIILYIGIFWSPCWMLNYPYVRCGQKHQTDKGWVIPSAHTGLQYIQNLSGEVRETVLIPRSAEI